MEAQSSKLVTSLTPPDVFIKFGSSKYFDAAYKQELPSDFNYETLAFNNFLCTRIPSTSSDSYGTSECLLYAPEKLRILNTPNFPRPPPSLFDPSKPPYTIKRTDSKGLGMFARYPLKVGDLILIERPFVVMPEIPDCDDEAVDRMANFAFKRLLRVHYERMAEEDKKAWKELAGGDGLEDITEKISAIFHTNTYSFKLPSLDREDQDYGALFKVMSRMNHSCRPNCSLRFDLDSFTFELHASRPIDKDEEICFCYCPIGYGTDSRLQYLEYHYGFSCSCFSCSPTAANPSNDALRITIPARLENLMNPLFDEETKLDRKGAIKIFYGCMSLLQDMEQEGMDGHRYYWSVTSIQVKVCNMLARISESSNEEERVRWQNEAVNLKEIPVDLFCSPTVNSLRL